eukprot:366431-Chlamydomonas_euryale.AAC.18
MSSPVLQTTNWWRAAMLDRGLSCCTARLFACCCAQPERSQTARPARARCLAKDLRSTSHPFSGLHAAYACSAAAQTCTGWQQDEGMTEACFTCTETGKLAVKARWPSPDALPAAAHDCRAHASLVALTRPNL